MPLKRVFIQNVEDYKKKVKEFFNIEGDRSEHFLIQHLVIILLVES